MEIISKHHQGCSIQLHLSSHASRSTIPQVDMQSACAMFQQDTRCIIFSPTSATPITFATLQPRAEPEALQAFVELPVPPGALSAMECCNAAAANAVCHAREHRIRAEANHGRCIWDRASTPAAAAARFSYINAVGNNRRLHTKQNLQNPLPPPPIPLATTAHALITTAHAQCR